MTTKYVAVDYNEDAGANPEVFNTLAEANNWIEDGYDRLTVAEAKKAHYYVAKVTEDNLEDKDDWASFDDYESGLDFFDSDEIGSIPVEYAGGESRYNPGAGIDYMLAKYDDCGENCLLRSYNDCADVTELYAEMANPTWNEQDECYEDEDYCYEDLKDAILKQAEENGLHPSRLSFWND